MLILGFGSGVPYYCRLRRGLLNGNHFLSLVTLTDMCEKLHAINLASQSTFLNSVLALHPQNLKISFEGSLHYLS